MDGLFAAQERVVVIGGEEEFGAVDAGQDGVGGGVLVIVHHAVEQRLEGGFVALLV